MRILRAWQAARYAAMVMASVALAAVLHGAILVFAKQLPIDTIRHDFVARTRHLPQQDLLPAQFKAVVQEDSGPASLAYLLNRFGETLPLLKLKSVASKQGIDSLHTPAGLVEAAAAFHYRVEESIGAYSQLPSGNGLPVIARLTAGNYVVVHEASASVTLFDSKVGRIVSVKRGMFEGLWQGHILRLVVDY